MKRSLFTDFFFFFGMFSLFSTAFFSVYLHVEHQHWKPVPVYQNVANNFWGFNISLKTKSAVIRVFKAPKILFYYLEQDT